MSAFYPYNKAKIEDTFFYRFSQSADTFLPSKGLLMTVKKKAGKPATSKTYKDSLTWTRSGWCKRIGKISVKGYAKGWKDPENFKPKKWYLGRDEDKAKLLAIQIKMVWEVRKEMRSWHPSDIAEVAVMKAQLYGQEVDREMRSIAQKAAKQWPDAMRNILNGNAEVHAEAEKIARAYMKDRVVPADKIIILDGPIGTLYQTINAFKTWVKQSASRSEIWRKELARRVEKIKESSDDIPLERFGRDAIAKLVDGHIASAKKGKASVDTAMNYIRATRQFVDWLDATDATKWEAPRRWEKLFAINRQQLSAGHARNGASGDEVRAFSVDELTTLYAEANDACRLYMLLALNCGWTQADIATLTAEHLKLRSSPPYAHRDRGKTGIYGRWHLWPETIAAIKAATKGTRRKKDEILLRTKRGTVLVRQTKGVKTDLIALAWRRLRISVHMKDKGMSFKHLRKTASQFVRDIAGKELSEAFLCHSDRTTGRHYNKFSDWSTMTGALTKVRKKLQPMFDAAKK
jgi:hypothetical protein